MQFSAEYDAATRLKKKEPDDLVAYPCTLSLLTPQLKPKALNPKYPQPSTLVP